ncbi:MAG TPA: hypothetical protein VNA32_04645, partial [Actinomycetota bacterium]|nr:hypothetical protein [Actinomycetota bacterium]
MTAWSQADRARGRLSRVAGLCGIGFVLVMAASVLAEGGRPDTFATDTEVAAFFRSSVNQN